MATLLVLVEFYSQSDLQFKVGILLSKGPQGGSFNLRYTVLSLTREETLLINK